MKDILIQQKVVNGKQRTYYYDSKKGGQPMCEVLKVLDSKLINGQLKYLVQWKEFKAKSWILESGFQPNSPFLKEYKALQVRESENQPQKNISKQNGSLKHKIQKQKKQFQESEVQRKRRKEDQKDQTRLIKNERNEIEKNQYEARINDIFHVMNDKNQDRILFSVDNQKFGYQNKILEMQDVLKLPSKILEDFLLQIFKT